MEITVEKLKELGFKRYYRDEVYRMKIGTDVINKPMYLTLVNFETSWTWYINSFEQFTGLKNNRQITMRTSCGGECFITTYMYGKN